MKKFNEKLIEVRTSKGISSKKIFANHFNVNYKTYISWETGLLTPHSFYQDLILEEFSKYPLKTELVVSNFSEELKIERKQKQISQQKLSEILNCSKSTIEQWEYEQKTPIKFYQILIINKIRSL